MTDIKSEVATATVEIVPEVDLEAFKKEMANMPLEVFDVKAGRRNSKKDADAIREAITLLQGVLGELEEADDPENGEDKAKANAAAEEPERSNPKKENLLRYINTMEV